MKILRNYMVYYFLIIISIYAWASTGSLWFLPAFAFSCFAQSEIVYDFAKMSVEVRE